MQKIIVIGNSGAGKSTFARKLKDKTNIPLYYLDMLWHNPDKTNISREEFDMKLHEIIKKDKWIIDGSYVRTLEARLKACDTVFLLDYPLEECLLSIEERVGKPREDMPWIESELDEEFKQWVINFPKNQLPKIYDLIDKYQRDKEIIIFKSRDESENYLKSLLL